MQQPVCPTCNQSVDYKQQACRRCGQALSWSDLSTEPHPPIQAPVSQQPLQPVPITQAQPAVQSAAQPGYTPPPVNVTVNVQQTQSQTAMAMPLLLTAKNNPGCLVQLLWYVIIGWWASALWISVAWILMATIIGLPIAAMMLNYIPKIIALRNPSPGLTIHTLGGVMVVTNQIPQINIIVRSIYFILIGLWASALWMSLAYLACATIIGLPLGFWMFDRVPAIATLKR